MGSTRLFDEFGDAYVAALRRMHDLIAAMVSRFGGAVVSTEGDGAFLALPTAGQALDALCTVQDTLEHDAEATADGQPALRIRAGAHTGHAVPHGDEYVSLAVHVAARVASTANAGQVVASQSVQHDLDKPRGAELGRFRLKDIAEPLTLWLVRGPDVPLRAAPERVTNVPTPRTSFVGRTAELTTLRALVEEPGIVTITGTAGIGKSRLATELCRQVCDHLPGGAWLADLAPVEEGSSVVAAVTAAIGSEAFTDALAAELDRRGDVLLVLDGCEHVIEDVADLVAGLAERCAHLRVVCTSRETLDFDGEHVLRLQPLDSGVGNVQSGAAEQLFLDRATAAGAKVSPADLPAIARICRLLDGLPVAVELAAARLPTVPAPALADALESNQIRLQRRGGPRHQRTLADLVAWSVRLLEPPQRVALQALSVFPGRFDAAAGKEVLAAVPNAAADALPELTRRSLVRPGRRSVPAPRDDPHVRIGRTRAGSAPERNGVARAFRLGGPRVSGADGAAAFPRRFRHRPGVTCCPELGAGRRCCGHAGAFSPGAGVVGPDGRRPNRSRSRRPDRAPSAAAHRGRGVLRLLGYRPLIPEELQRFHTDVDAALPRRRFVLTADDGFVDTVRELVDQRRVRPQMFVVTQSVGVAADWFGGTPLAGWDALCRLSESGGFLGSHARHHMRLTEVDDVALRDELAGSLSDLAGRTSLSVPILAYPHGSCDRRVRQAAVDAGYALAYTTSQGRNGAGTDPWSLRRVEPKIWDTTASFLWKAVTGQSPPGRWERRLQRRWRRRAQSARG